MCIRGFWGHEAQVIWVSVRIKKCEHGFRPPLFDAFESYGDFGILPFFGALGSLKGAAVLCFGLDFMDAGLLYDFDPVQVVREEALSGSALLFWGAFGGMIQAGEDQMAQDEHHQQYTMSYQYKYQYPFAFFLRLP